MHDSYSIFESQLADTCKQFPNFRIKQKNDRHYLKGTIDILNSEQELVQSFLIEIHWADGFPYRFPELFEVGGIIPCHSDWHKYNDNSCCITVEPDEIIQCKYGISVFTFINLQVIPHLANQCYRIIEGKYKNEFSHGKRGLNEYYTDLMGTPDKDKWVKYVRYALEIDKIKVGRNDPCICGEQRKFKNCHHIIFEKLRLIGKENIFNHIKEILT